MDKKTDGGDEEAARLINDPANSYLVRVESLVRDWTSTSPSLSHDILSRVFVQDKMTLVHHAAVFGRAALVDLLLDKGAAVDVDNDVSNDPTVVRPSYPPPPILPPSAAVLPPPLHLFSLPWRRVPFSLHNTHGSRLYH